MTLTATQLKQQTYLMDNVKKEDIVITKRDRPFAVIIDIDRYHKLIGNNRNDSIKKKLKALDSLGSYSLGGKNIDKIKEEMYEN
jgi:prevent-host-death family protein